MARQGITFEQVAAVADALAGEGQQPTIRAVRERLGDTGSPNTIHKHLAAWREARPVAAAAAPELPQALTAAIAAEIERAASRARGEIEGRLVQAQAEAAELAAAGEVLEGERDELAEQVAVLTTERDTLAGKAAQQAADLAEAQQRIEREQQAAESARLEVATARHKIEAQAERVSEQAARSSAYALRWPPNNRAAPPPNNRPPCWPPSWRRAPTV
jgi:chromosome segregation ATPase